MNILKKIYSKIFRGVIRFQNFLNAKQLRRLSKKLMVEDQIQGDVLILVPHADDEWIGCSRLFNMPNVKILLCNMDMQGGDTEKTHRCRYLELMQMAELHGVLVKNVYGTINEKITGLTTLILETNPQYICVPFYCDWHFEHLAVMRMLYQALSKLTQEQRRDLKIFMYQVSVPIPSKMITHCFPMSKKEQQEKWNTFRSIYKTQTFLPVYRYIYNEYIHGGFSDSHAAEVFVCEICSKWIRSFGKRQLHKSRRELLIKNLGNLKKIRIASVSVLKEIP